MPALIYMLIYTIVNVSYHNISYPKMPKITEEDKLNIKVTSINDNTPLFTRTTSYAHSKVSSSSSSTKKNPKKKNHPKKITPVKSIITKQIAAHPSITKYLVRKSSNKAIVPFRISSKSDSYSSKYQNYPLTEDDPLPGDLVMASAGDIGLKEYVRGDLKRNEMMFGKAKSFTYVNHMFNYSDPAEDFMVKDMELLRVEWSTQPGTTTTHAIDMSRLFVKIVAKKNDPDMRDVNDFLRDEARKHFYFGLPEGWLGVDKVAEEDAVKAEGSV